MMSWYPSRMDGFEKLNNSKLWKHPSDRIYLKEYLRLLEEYINKDINKRFFIFEQIKTLEMKPFTLFSFALHVSIFLDFTDKSKWYTDFIQWQWMEINWRQFRHFSSWS